MECDLKNKSMVATLQSRKEALEAKLCEKTLELKDLCIQEAELTGILPPETPIEPGEKPPVFKRRIGTTFTYPENLISKLKSREEEELAKLELEYKIQTSIAEAALGLANDCNASKSIRRKHRLEYQQSQRRLSELETRLNVLRQSIKTNSQLKQRKKPRPPLNVDTDCVDSLEVSADDLSGRLMYIPDKTFTLPSVNRDVIRNSHFYNSFGKSHNHSGHMHQGYASTKNQWNRNQQYRRSVERMHHNSGCYDDGINSLEDSDTWRNTAPVGYFSNQCYTTLPSESNRVKSRYNGRDRRYRNTHYGGCDLEPPYSGPSHASPTPICSQRNSPVVHNDTIHRTSQPCVPLPSDSSILNAVLLPNQTYPENSLMRTQSLGDVEHSKKSLDTHSLEGQLQNFQSNTLGRKTREKEWRETLLDSDCEPKSHTPPLHPRASKMAESPVPQRPFSMRGNRTPPPPLPPPHSLPSTPPPPTGVNKSPIKSPVLLDTVPFESPKNHTVVEVGKWQPYREVTKPFEMSDFYKYSTKFRKNGEQNKNSSKEEETVLNRNVMHMKNSNSQDNPLAYIHKSNEDINKNTLNEVPFYDPSLLNNITQRRHRPLTMLNDGNRNRNVGKHWSDE